MRTRTRGGASRAVSEVGRGVDPSETSRPAQSLLGASTEVAGEADLDDSGLEAVNSSEQTSGAQEVTKRGPVNTRGLTTEDWTRARDQFLQYGTITSITNLGFGSEQARRLIFTGLPHLKLPPLQQLARTLASEEDKLTRATIKAETERDAQALAKHLEARRAIAEAARAKEALVLQDAANSRGEEVKLVRANRIAAQYLAQVNVSLLRTAGSLAESVLRDVDGVMKLSPKGKVELIGRIAQIVKYTAETSAKAVHMERLLMGEPTNILGVQGGGTSPQGDMTPEEAEQWFDLAKRAFARRASRKHPIEADVIGEPVDQDLYEPGEGED